jgi:hypothetical protein
MAQRKPMLPYPKSALRGTRFAVRTFLSFPFAVGIGIEDELALKEWFDVLARGTPRRPLAKVGARPLRSNAVWGQG